MADLEELYREIILDHYRSPRNRGELRVAPRPPGGGLQPAVRRRGRVVHAGRGRQLADLKIGDSGCSISQSSASMMSAAVKGKPLDEVRQLISTFKGMMSIHEATLDGRRGRRRAEGEPEEIDLDKLGRAGGAAGCREVPGAHQVRHPQLERPGPGARRGGGRGLLGRRDTTPGTARLTESARGLGPKRSVPARSNIGPPGGCQEASNGLWPLESRTVSVENCREVAKGGSKGAVNP